MLRIILSLIITVLYLIVTLPMVIWFELFHKNDRDFKERISKPMIQWMFRIYISLSGMRLTVSGKENIPDRSVLFIANHRSIFDVIATYAKFERPVAYVAKRSLLKFPLFANWLTYIGTLYFDRDNLRDGVKMLKDAMALTEDGFSVFVFPEGTRSKDDSELPLLPFHEGSFRIATRTGCPIIPVAIHNMADVFEKQFPRLVPRDVHIEFGEPIDPTSFTKSEQKHLGKFVSDRITEMLEKHAG